MVAPWELYFDGSSRQHQVEIGIVLVSPTWEKLRYIVYLLFQATNNAAEYEGLVAELTLALSFGVKEIRVMGDSQLVINQVNGECACNHP
jgi:ribonuclease HI